MTMVIGATVLLGWAVDVPVLKSLVPGLVEMKANTAVSFVLLGLALLCQQRARRSGVRSLACAVAAAVAGLALTSLAQDVLGVDLGVDRLFVDERPGAPHTVHLGRMAPTTSFNFVALGTALALQATRRSWRMYAVDALALSALLVSLLVIVGYLYGVRQLYGVPSFTPMAVNTAAGFALLAPGVLAAQPERGVAALVLGRTVGGELARRLLPVVVLLLPAIGWLSLRGHRAGYFGDEISLALLVLASMVLLGTVVVATATSLGRADEARRAQEEVVRAAYDEAQRANRRLAENEQTLNLFFTLSLDLLCIGSTDGYFKRLNPAFEVLGWSREELLARPFLDFVHPDDRAATVREVERLALGIPSIRFENRYRCRDGSYRIFAWTAAPDPSGLLYAVARDVTDARAVEESLREAKTAAEVANRELESFSYSVAHDLRAPLRSLDGFSQALLEDYAEKLDDDGRRYLGFIRESSQQMAQLIDDLLELSRVTRAELRRRSVELLPLVRTTLGALERAEPARRVTVVVDDRLGTVHADPRLLSVVFANLLGNAWKFTSKHPEARVEVGVTCEHAERTFFVRDNGAGFDMAYASKLFGVFQRLHRQTEFEGTGIGLATVQRILARHGGRIWAHGEVDRGATFYFTLDEGERTS